jgi:ABC-type Mn2+/Zn2+ transport system ATPase subunit
VFYNILKKNDYFFPSFVDANMLLSGKQSSSKVARPVIIIETQTTPTIWLHLQSFRCHTNLQIVLRGGTMIELKGPSGVGKSTIFAAIFWVMYGEGRHLYNFHNPKKCQVDMKVGYKRAEELTITRKKNPELLTVIHNGTNMVGDVAQSYIDSLFGNKELSMTCSYIDQKSGGNSLLNAKNTERLEILNMLSFNKDNPEIYITSISKKLSEIQKSLAVKESVYEREAAVLESYIKLNQLTKSMKLDSVQLREYESQGVDLHAQLKGYQIAAIHNERQRGMKSMTLTKKEELYAKMTEIRSLIMPTSQLENLHKQMEVLSAAMYDIGLLERLSKETGRLKMQLSQLDMQIGRFTIDDNTIKLINNLTEDQINENNNKYQIRDESVRKCKSIGIEYDSLIVETEIKRIELNLSSQIKIEAIDRYNRYLSQVTSMFPTSLSQPEYYNMPLFDLERGNKFYHDITKIQASDQQLKILGLDPIRFDSNISGYLNQIISRRKNLDWLESIQNSLAANFKKKELLTRLDSIPVPEKPVHELASLSEVTEYLNNFRDTRRYENQIFEMQSSLSVFDIHISFTNDSVINAKRRINQILNDQQFLKIEASIKASNSDLTTLSLEISNESEQCGISSPTILIVNDIISSLKIKIAEMRSSRDVLTCPHCNGHIRYKDQKLVPEANGPSTYAEIKTKENNLICLESLLSKIMRVDNIRHRINDLETREFKEWFNTKPSYIGITGVPQSDHVILSLSKNLSTLNNIRFFHQNELISDEQFRKWDQYRKYISDRQNIIDSIQSLKIPESFDEDLLKRGGIIPVIILGKREMNVINQFINDTNIVESIVYNTSVHLYITDEQMNLCKTYGKYMTMRTEIDRLREQLPDDIDTVNVNIKAGKIKLFVNNETHAKEISRFNDLKQIRFPSGSIIPPETIKESEKYVYLLNQRNLIINQINELPTVPITIEEANQKSKLRNEIAAIIKDQTNNINRLTICDEELNNLIELEDRIIIRDDLEKLINDTTSSINAINLILLNGEKCRYYDNESKKLESLGGELSLLDNDAVICKKLRENAIRAEYLCLERTVDSLNIAIGNVVSTIFHNDITVSIELTKQLKTSDRMVPNVNIKIFHNGAIYDSVTQLSRGESDRVSLAMTIAMSQLSSFPILVFDESLSSLDLSLKELCIETIREHTTKTVLIVDHESVEGFYDESMAI